MTTRIYTKTGDDGTTGLFGGQRLAKDHIRVEAYGTVDELNAHLGMARALAAATSQGSEANHDSVTSPTEDATSQPSLDGVLDELQCLLFDLGAELATPPSDARRAVPVDAAVIGRLEQHIDRFTAELAPLQSFILPGGSRAAAALHVARAVCRRAERLVVHLRSQEPATSTTSVIVLNRLSDLLFVLARVANRRCAVADVPWRRH